MEKIWGIGEKLYLLENNGNIFIYVVEDFGVYMTEEGNHTVGLTVKKENGSSFNTPYWTVEQLCKSGYLWREGREKMAKFLREKEPEISKKFLDKTQSEGIMKL